MWHIKSVSPASHTTPQRKTPRMLVSGGLTKEERG
jgi:hypothetical protein